MSISDEDMEQLKSIAMKAPVIRALVKKRKTDFNECPWVLAIVRGSLAVELLDGLVNRLELAEAIIVNNENLLDRETPNLMEVWRKEIGK